MHPKTTIIAVVAVGIIVIASVAGVYVTNPGLIFPATSNNRNHSQVQVVAAQNFWGSLISQLGGTHTQVLSIVSDPNADPHEYASNAADARAFATSSLVIVNGAGYDDWALRLMAANNNPNQKILNVADLVGKKAGDNPHFWYSPTYVNLTVRAMYSDLVSIDNANTVYYRQQYSNLNVSLGAYNHRVADIKQQFSGAKVASTENIFEYLAIAASLNLVSPPEFMKAVAEGTDPSPQSIVQFRQQLQTGNVTLLVYNQQTVSPLTQDMRTLATEKGIPVVAITETVQPPNASFQEWMNSELISIENGLSVLAH
jgi:zinc/manganese transport system substrate-binding protein